MTHELLFDRTFTALKVYLEKGEAIKAESGAMVSMDTTIEVEGKMEGGVFGGLKRMLAGEKFFFQTLKAAHGPGETILAPASPGDITYIELDGSSEWNVQKDGFFAGTEELSVDSKMQNLAKGVFSGEGFFIVKISGTGKLFVSSFGATYKIDVPSGKEYLIDNGHLVAWPSTMEYSIEKASKGLISSFTSGEGLVTRFRGPGQVYIQTRNAPAFGSWIFPFIPGKK